MRNKVVSREEWLKERNALLEKEKEFTRARDQMTAEIRNLPWVRVEKQYQFDGPIGTETLSDLFGKHNQLAIYHFMLGPGWDEGCKSCSFWADNFQGISRHLAHRDVSFVVISRAPLVEIEKFKNRMAWNFKWVSSFNTEFNFDYHVSFKQEEIDARKVSYNYTSTPPYVGEEMPGASFFYRDAGTVFHTYSTFARGLDILNGAYNWLDLAPMGRDEDPEATMSWVRHHDKYT